MKRSGWILTIIGAVVLLVIAAAVLLLGQDTDTLDDTAVRLDAPVAGSEQALNESSATRQATVLLIGDPNAPVTIVEYMDYKCPNCNKLHQGAMKDIRKNYVDTGLANIEVRPYPLFGEDSGLALYASYCALAQGKFAAYYDKMYDYMWTNYYQSGDYSAETKQLFSPEKLGELAGEAGLNATEFTTCAGGTEHGDAYNAAVHKAAADEVQATPSIIIGDQKVVGPQAYSTYDALLKLETL